MNGAHGRSERGKGNLSVWLKYESKQMSFSGSRDWKIGQSKGLTAEHLRNHGNSPAYVEQLTNKTTLSTTKAEKGLQNKAGLEPRRED